MSELSVGIDVSALAQTRAGTARHVRGLLTGLERRPEVQVRPLGFQRTGRLAAVVRDTAWYPLALPAAARRTGVDLLHCPTYRAPPASRTPLVVTFHDLAVLRLPGTFNRWSRTYSRAALPLVARAARRVIAVSTFTASELMTLLAVPARKIAVVPNAVGEPFTGSGEAADGEYVLAVGTREPRKNLGRLVAGFERSSLADGELLLAGAAGWGRAEVVGPRVRKLGFVPDDELARLFRGARAVAYVSVYEGFGLPVLEAMACGAPVVAARIPPVEEVAGDAAVLVDPLDPEAIARGLDEAAARREELAARGRERARSYTWERVAEETLAVYREALA